MCNLLRFNTLPSNGELKAPALVRTAADANSSLLPHLTVAITHTNEHVDGLSFSLGILRLFGRRICVLGMGGTNFFPLGEIFGLIEGFVNGN